MKMIESYPVPETPRTMLSAQRNDHNPTVGDNIEEKIRYFESEIARLKQSKEDLAPLLKMRIRDIRQAMDY
jgi:hypothetical protein